MGRTCRAGDYQVYVVLDDCRTANQSFSLRSGYSGITRDLDDVQMLIDNSAESMSTRSGDLYLQPGEATLLKISNDPAFPGTRYGDHKWWSIPAEGIVESWFLDGDSGEQTAYVKFRDFAGNERTLSDPIDANLNQ